MIRRANLSFRRACVLDAGDLDIPLDARIALSGARGAVFAGKSAS